MLGGRDQGWVEDGEIELRDLEEWFADGREREYKVRDWVLDVGEVASFLGGQYFVEWGRDRGWSKGMTWAKDWEGVNVRVVAWKKSVGR